mmetsp:Transcript_1954/g.7673  ORF Transcript_1954/g.7673 Transcript_1954/m.7673 type:complete len:280 (-) Transcript_1954:2369-3208(-)
MCWTADWTAGSGPCCGLACLVRWPPCGGGWCWRAGIPTPACRCLRRRLGPMEGLRPPPAAALRTTRSRVRQRRLQLPLRVPKSRAQARAQARATPQAAAAAAAAASTRKARAGPDPAPQRPRAALPATRRNPRAHRAPPRPARRASLWRSGTRSCLHTSSTWSRRALTRPTTRWRQGAQRRAMPRWRRAVMRPRAALRRGRRPTSCFGRECACCSCALASMPAISSGGSGAGFATAESRSLALTRPTPAGGTSWCGSPRRWPPARWPRWRPGSGRRAPR